MNNYEESKKTRRTAAMIYLFIMAILVSGSYLSQQQKSAVNDEIDDLSISYELPVLVSEQNPY